LAPALLDGFLWESNFPEALKSRFMAARRTAPLVANRAWQVGAWRGARVNNVDVG